MTSHATAARSAAALEAGERVLDLACGTGLVARPAAERVGPSGAVTGVDLNPEMLGVARSVVAGGSAIEWRQADAAATGLPGGAYDAAQEARVALARELEERWRPFAPSGGPMHLELGVLTATGC